MQSVTSLFSVYHESACGLVRCGRPSEIRSGKLWLVQTEAVLVKLDSLVSGRSWVYPRQ